MDTAQADKLIAQYQRAQALHKKAKALMQAIGAQLQPGELAVGTVLKIQRTHGGFRSRIDAFKLRRYVPQATIDMCRTRSQQSPQIRITKVVVKRAKKEKTK